MKQELTPRQAQIVALLTEGMENKEIAHELHVVEGTVKAHIKLLMRKLRLRNRTQLAVWCVRRELSGE